MRNIFILLLISIFASCSSIKNTVYTTLGDKKLDYPYLLSLEDSTFTAIVFDIANSSMDSSLDWFSSGQYFIRHDTVFLISAIGNTDINYKTKNRASPLGKLSDFVKQSTNNPAIPTDYIKISIDLDHYHIFQWTPKLLFTYTDKKSMERTELDSFPEIQKRFDIDNNFKGDTVHFLLPKTDNNLLTIKVVDASSSIEPYLFTLDLDDIQSNDVLLSVDIFHRIDLRASFINHFYDFTGDTYLIKNGKLLPTKGNALWHEEMKNLKLRKTSLKKIPSYYTF